MTMTEMKSDLTRWLPLFIRDTELRPLGLTHDGEFWWLEAPHKDGQVYLGTSAEDKPIQDVHAELLIIAKTIRWFNRHHEGLVITDGSHDEDFKGEWPGGFSVRIYDPYYEAIRSDDRLVDALYESVIAALDNHDQNVRDQRKYDSWLGRIKRKIFKDKPDQPFGQC
jgi:hypothetical protein